MTDVLAEVRAHLTEHFTRAGVLAEPDEASVTFLGTERFGILRFALPDAEHVSLEVYNLLGQRVVTLVDEQMSAGTHTVIWNGIDAGGRQVATGVYFYRISAGEYNDVKKMILIK